MFPGYKITIEGEDFVVPALSLGQLRNGLLKKLDEHDKTLTEGKTFEVLIARGEIILEALRRNYPDFPQEKLFNYLDVANVSPIWLTVLGASGFSGEAKAAMTTEAGGI